MERGLNRLVDNIPDIGTAGYNGAMRDMVDEITNRGTLIPYLVASNIVNGEVRVTVLHSIKRYSTGFGGNNALHGKTLGLLGEVMDTQLPPLIRFHQDPNHDLVHALLVEEVRVPSNAQVDAYFSLPVAENLMVAPTVAARFLKHKSCVPVSHSFVLGTLLHGPQDPLPSSTDGKGIGGYTNEWG
jgi:hypothetical protein